MKQPRTFSIQLIMTALIVVSFATVFHGEIASAATECGGVTTSIISCSSAKDSTGSPVVALLVVAIQILTGLIGIIAIGALVYAGILYSSASDNSQQVQQAKDIIKNTVIGLVTFAAMALALNFLIPGGLLG